VGVTVLMVGLALGGLSGRGDPGAPGARLNRESVDELGLAWSVEGFEPTMPVVVGDSVVVGTGAGGDDLFAFPIRCADPCEPLWIASTGREVANPVVADGVVYVVQRWVEGETGRLFAFPLACGDHGTTCEPLWSAGAGGAPFLDGGPLVEGGRIYVGTVGRVSAFDVGCGDEGVTCRAVWHARVPGRVVQMTLAGDRLLVGTQRRPFQAGSVPGYSTTGELISFPVDCTARCRPLSQTHSPTSSWRLESTGDSVVVSRGGRGEIAVYPASCAGTDPCDPIWTADVAGPVGGVEVVDDTVYLAAVGSGVYAFPARCANDGSVCAASWSASDFLSGWLPVARPAVSGDLVFVGSSYGSVYAFDTRCSASCDPVWETSVGSSDTWTGPSTDGERLYVAMDGEGNGGISVLTLEPARVHDRGSAEVPALPIAAVLLTLTLLVIDALVRRDRSV
jgi:hypothetical protein